MRKNIKLGLGLLTVLATPLAVNAVDSHEVQAEYKGNIFYANGQPANWWYSDGKDWFFFQNGKKLTGVGRDNAGSHYFVNGKYANGTYNGKTYKNGKEVATPTTPAKPKNGYVNGLYYVNNQLANWWYDDGQDWYFFQNGKKLTGQGRDNAGVHNFVNGKYAKETVKEGYVNGLFYVKGQLANWWYSDGKDWFFFKDGKKLTGEGKDNAGNHYFVNGKYATGTYNGKTYKDGKETKVVKEGYVDGVFYVKGEKANWWYSDGKDWFFFKDGKKLTGKGRDNAGEHDFVNGKYKTTLNGYVDGIFYVKGEKANWWYSDGKDWYFFKDGKKLTGEGKDNAGSHYFVNGKYATGTYNNKTYVDGKEVKAVQNGYSNGLFFANGKLANWWYDDGKDWYFFKDGKKLTGKGRDNAGEHNFINGKYAPTNTAAISMPQYYQGDSRWGYRRYGMSNLRNTGCVPTSLAMIFSGLGKPVTPTAVADTIYNNTNEYNTRELGTSQAGADYAVRFYGFNNSIIQSKEQLVDALKKGYPVLAAMGNGYFVKGYSYTHAVALSGYQNGKTKAMDPDNATTTQRWYSVDQIWNQRSFEPSDTVMGGSFMSIGKK